MLLLASNSRSHCGHISDGLCCHSWVAGSYLKKPNTGTVGEADGASRVSRACCLQPRWLHSAGNRRPEQLSSRRLSLTLLLFSPGMEAPFSCLSCSWLLSSPLHVKHSFGVLRYGEFKAVFCIYPRSQLLSPFPAIGCSGFWFILLPAGKILAVC